MLDYEPPVIPELTSELVVPTTARRWIWRLCKIGLVLSGIAVILGVVLGSMDDAPNFMAGILAFSIIFAVFSFLASVFFIDNRRKELRREDIKRLLHEGVWQPYEVYGKRVESDSSSTTVGYLLGGILGAIIGSMIGKKSKRKATPFEMALPCHVDLRKMIKCRAQSGVGRSKLLAYSPDPDGDKQRGVVWVLALPDCKYGIAEVCFYYHG